jgi:cytochrome c-type biogenesis protein
MNVEVSLLAAFAAGLLSISSPCVLPLVPIYLAHLAGVGGGYADAAARRRIVANAAASVAGFSLVFVSLGVALGAAGVLVETGSLVAGNRFWIVRLGGALLVLLGLHQLGIIRLPFLDRERRFATDRLPVGQVGSSFVVGVTFGAGWSPCVGPILGAILTMAAGQGSIERAGLLLVAYSLGLAVPFMAAAVAYGSSTTVIRSLNRQLAMVSSVSGGVMVALGAIMLLGLYQQFFARLVALSPWMPLEPSL